MTVKFVLVFVGILFISISAQTTDFPSSNVSENPQKCGENEEWNDCGTMCPPKCPGRFMPPRIVCNKMCYSSCQCTKGFLRNFNGKCVKPKDCPKITRPIIPQKPITAGPM
uniref:TIL domain-containing protein n=1 Tax=Panagrolaimus davidi TaxID=227884 RepID=A0A914QLT5_9BILA